MRIRFKFEPSSDSLRSDWLEKLPTGFTLERMDRSIAEQLEQDLVRAGNAAWFEEVWSGIDRFLDDGFGFAVSHDAFIVSNTRSWSVKDGVAAIQVSTRSKYRHIGLGYLCCRAFIQHCLENGLTPEYSCVAENVASIALARKLGFVPCGLIEESG